MTTLSRWPPYVGGLEKGYFLFLCATIVPQLEPNLTTYGLDVHGRE